MQVVVQSPGVLERSLDVCDVLVGNINTECSSLVGCVTSGLRDSSLVLDVESASRTWPREATVVDVDTQVRGSIANPKLTQNRG